MAPRPRRTTQSKPLSFASCNADGVRGRKLEVEHFLSQHGVDICLLIETFLNSGQAFRFAIYACYRTDRATGGGTAILLRRGVVHHSVPVPCLTHLEATAMQVPLQPLRYYRYLGHCDNEELPIPAVSDFVPGTKLGPSPGTH
jgi:hypothetical protein